MKKTFLTMFLCAMCCGIGAQGQEKFPLGAYEELADPNPGIDSESWSRLSSTTQLSWSSQPENQYPLARQGLEKRTNQRSGALMDQTNTQECPDNSKRPAKRFIRYSRVSHRNPFCPLRDDRRTEQRP